MAAPEVEQEFRQPGLQTGDRRMRARHEHAHRRVLPAVHPGRGIDLGASLEQVLAMSTAFAGVFCRWPSTPLAAT
jgi:hypothetical protein